MFSIHLDLVSITKYRKRALTGEVAVRVRDIIREVCRRDEVEILRGHVSSNHVHLFVSLPPDVTIRRLVQRLKGKTSSTLLRESSHLRKTFWGRHLLARGYFCCSSGNVTDEVIKAYIESQRHRPDDGFRIEGEAPPPV